VGKVGNQSAVDDDGRRVKDRDDPFGDTSPYKVRDHHFLLLHLFLSLVLSLFHKLSFGPS